eukprot:2673-Chlamydomonas_euryale.AAC.4
MAVCMDPSTCLNRRTCASLHRFLCRQAATPAKDEPCASKAAVRDDVADLLAEDDAPDNNGNDGAATATASAPATAEEAHAPEPVPPPGGEIQTHADTKEQPPRSFARHSKLEWVAPAPPPDTSVRARGGAL